MDDKTTADKQSDAKNTRIVIPPEGLARIEKEGQIPPLSDTLRTEIEDVLNNYVFWNRRDRNVLSAKAEKAHYTRLHRLVKGLLDALDHVRCKFAGNPDFDEPTANADV